MASSHDHLCRDILALFGEAFQLYCLGFPALFSGLSRQLRCVLVHLGASLAPGHGEGDA